VGNACCTHEAKIIETGLAPPNLVIRSSAWRASRPAVDQRSLGMGCGGSATLGRVGRPRLSRQPSGW
jgi:hypothetical protein